MYDFTNSLSFMLTHPPSRMNVALLRYIAVNPARMQELLAAGTGAADVSTFMRGLLDDVMRPVARQRGDLLALFHEIRISYSGLQCSWGFPLTVPAHGLSGTVCMRRSQHLLREERLGQRALELHLVAFLSVLLVSDGNNNLWNAVDLAALRHRGELGNRDHVRRNVGIGDRKLVGQPGRAWAVGSGRRDEDLDVQIALDAVQYVQRSAGRLQEAGLAARDIKQIFMRLENSYPDGMPK